jgi:hypothetical protein
MRKAVSAVFLALAFALGGCNSGPSIEQQIAFRDYSEPLRREAAAHKITWVEYAAKTNNYMRILNNYKGGDVQAEEGLSYRLALAAEVDAGRSTPERFDYEWKHYLAELERRRDAAVAAANEAAADSMIQAGNSLKESADRLRGYTCMGRIVGPQFMATCQ